MPITTLKPVDDEDPARQFVFVAGINGTEETVNHIQGLLRAEEIDCRYEGSVFYDLLVDREKLTRAKEILRKAQADGWYIGFADEKPET